jgi:hypothetical protein
LTSGETVELKLIAADTTSQPLRVPACCGNRQYLPNIAPTWKMATMDAPVVRLSRDGDRHLDVLKWGRRSGKVGTERQ